MKYQSIRHNSDFVRAYKKGKNLVHSQVVVYWNKNRAKCTRVGITASKKVGNAVQRNRARRVIRHALFQVLPPNVGNYDLVFVARGRTGSLSSTQLAGTLHTLLHKAGLLPAQGGL